MYSSHAAALFMNLDRLWCTSTPDSWVTSAAITAPMLLLLYDGASSKKKWRYNYFWWWCWFLVLFWWCFCGRSAKKTWLQFGGWLSLCLFTRSFLAFGRSAQRLRYPRRPSNWAASLSELCDIWVWYTVRNGSTIPSISATSDVPGIAHPLLLEKDPLLHT